MSCRTRDNWESYKWWYVVCKSSVDWLFLNCFENGSPKISLQAQIIAMILLIRQQEDENSMPEYSDFWIPVTHKFYKDSDGHGQKQYPYNIVHWFKLNHYLTVEQICNQYSVIRPQTSFTTTRRWQFDARTNLLNILPTTFSTELSAAKASPGLFCNEH